ncbi:MAG: peptidylprolyl isomerase [Myxococcota bacterium]
MGARLVAPRLAASVVAVTVLLAGACASGGSLPGSANPGPTPTAAAPAAEAEPTEAKYAATQVLVSYAGAQGAGAGVTRSQAEAQALAEQVWQRASGGEALEGLARELSDATSGPRGGSVGTWRTGTMVPGFERAVAALKVGGLSRPFATPYGWHVVRRDAVTEIAARHVLVAYQGAWRSASTRSKEQARARAEQVLAKLGAGEDFAAVAKAMSDDPTASVGGDLGVVAPGQLIPAFEEAAFALPVGGRSGIVETPYGFHVIERTR